MIIEVEISWRLFGKICTFFFFLRHEKRELVTSSPGKISTFLPNPSNKGIFVYLVIYFEKALDGEFNGLGKNLQTGFRLIDGLVFASKSYKILSLILSDGIVQRYTIHLLNNLFLKLMWLD